LWPERISLVIVRPQWTLPLPGPTDTGPSKSAGLITGLFVCMYPTTIYDAVESSPAAHNADISYRASSKKGWTLNIVVLCSLVYGPAPLNVHHLSRATLNWVLLMAQISDKRSTDRNFPTGKAYVTFPIKLSPRGKLSAPPRSFNATFGLTSEHNMPLKASESWTVQGISYTISLRSCLMTVSSMYLIYIVYCRDRPSVLVGPVRTRTQYWTIGESFGQWPITNGADFGQVQPRLMIWWTVLNDGMNN
jgi:hypothetical protein